MRIPRTVVLATLAGALLSAACVRAQSASSQQPPASTPTFSINSTLVYLDVSVIDKQGRSVVSGLTQRDFHITEDKQPQRIFSFEAPQLHRLKPYASEENPRGKVPVTIIVLDMLDSSFSNFAYLRWEARRFLMGKPALLASPTELMVLGNESLAMLQGYTRDRDDLVHALDRLPAALPYKEMNGAFAWERFAQSIDALQQIALQNKGVPGHKIVLWLGHGGPGVYLQNINLTAKEQDMLREYAHHTTNLLVDSRMSLYVIYPGLSVHGADFSLSGEDSGIDLGDNDPFAGDINFGLFVNTTGGKLYYNRNDLDHLMNMAQHLGSEYYTLTYQPSDAASDGGFRRIRVTVDNRDYRVVTKAGYYASDSTEQMSSGSQRNLYDLTEAGIATMPFTALHLSLRSIVQHPDTHTVDMAVRLENRNIEWSATPDGKSQAKVIFGAFCSDSHGDIVASNLHQFTFTTPLLDPSANLAMPPLLMTTTVHFPRKAQQLRIAVEGETGGRIGTLDLSRKAVEAAPSQPTPDKELEVRPATAQPAPPAPGS